MSRVGDEYLDYLLDVDDRTEGRAKPRYFYGDNRSANEAGRGHYDKIPEDQFWNPEEGNKHDK